MDPLPINDAITIPASDLVWTAARAGGPGGQNVNKVSSKVELRFDLARTAVIPPDALTRLRALAAGRIDRDGQLGDGQRTQDPQGPVLVIATPGAARTNPLQRVSSIAAGGATACAVLQDHSVRCWGSNQDGALGNGNTTQQSGPVPVTW